MPGRHRRYGTRVGAHSGWRYCPRCASELRRERGRVECAGCGFVHYASSVPAVSAFVVDDAGRLLLARRAREPDAGKWDTPGGFLEEGEDPIAGLRREVLEETSLEVEVVDFLGAFTDTYGDGADERVVLNLTWRARVVAGEPVAADDVSELRWFAPGRMPSGDQLAFRWLAPVLRDWARKTEGPETGPSVGEGRGKLA